MTDERYVFVHDVRDKKNIGHSAAKRNRTGKGPVRMPSDYMTAKEKKAMNGEEKTYRLGEPMKLRAFMSMPEDLQRQYITGLRDRFDATDVMIAEMLGCNRAYVHKVCQRIGCLAGARGRRKADEAGFRAWIEHGAGVCPEAAVETKIPTVPVENPYKVTVEEGDVEKRNTVLSAEFAAYTTPADLALLLKVLFGDEPRTYRVVAE